MLCFLGTFNHIACSSYVKIGIYIEVSSSNITLKVVFVWDENREDGK